MDYPLYDYVAYIKVYREFLGGTKWNDPFFENILEISNDLTWSIKNTAEVENGNFDDNGEAKGCFAINLSDPTKLMWNRMDTKYTDPNSWYLKIDIENDGINRCWSSDDTLFDVLTRAE